MRLRAGKTHFLVIFGILGAIIVVALFLFRGSDPAVEGTKFMQALARGDAKTLAELSHDPSLDQAALEKEWEFTTEVGKHYLFMYKMMHTTRHTEESATVNMKVWRDYGPSSYDENFGLPMVKVDGEWKVSLNELSRALYPALPR